MPVMDGRNSVMMDNTKDDSYRLPDVEVNCLNLQLSLREWFFNINYYNWILSHLFSLNYDHVIS